MIYLDVDALNAQFFATTLSYKNPADVVVEIPEAQVLVENKPEPVDEEQIWCRWTINPGESKIVTVGPAIFKSLGTATLQVFVPKGKGATNAVEVADSFLASFREWRSADKALRIYKTAMDKGSDKDFHQVNVTAFYESRRQA